MIYSIEGSITAIYEQNIILKTNGISYAIFVPRPELFQKDKTITLFTYIQWSSEQAPALYGFKTELEKSLFEAIISCSGVGPKLGIAILQSMEPDEFIGVIQRGDEKALNAINGIGTKKAEQIIVQLKYKIQKLIDAGITIPSKTVQSITEVKEVLKSLKYGNHEINAALKHLKEQESLHEPFDVQMRKALSFLSKSL